MSGWARVGTELDSEHCWHSFLSATGGAVSWLMDLEMPFTQRSRSRPPEGIMAILSQDHPPNQCTKGAQRMVSNEGPVVEPASTCEPLQNVKASYFFSPHTNCRRCIILFHMDAQRAGYDSCEDGRRDMYPWVPRCILYHVLLTWYTDTKENLQRLLILACD